MMKKKLGFAMCGSFCTHRQALDVMRILAGKYDIVPILSDTVVKTDTRFGSSAILCEQIRGICGKEPVSTIVQTEKFGPSDPLDLMLICPCTGNTAAKLANGITDTPVTMAAKAHLRSNRPLIIALASNDAMSANFSNIGTLLGRKHIYFVPMKQDDPEKKPHSLVADFEKCPKTVENAELGIQLRPLFL